ncbi:hypothetical protein CLOP_g17161 [Closterium sp. NIES-67]|nr:hypothetical protein CLOP_g17161 [Closterium sp. NIES-67]
MVTPSPSSSVDPNFMERFFSFMSHFDQQQQTRTPAHSRQSNGGNMGLAPMSLDNSSFKRHNQAPTFAPYHSLPGTFEFMPPRAVFTRD